MMIALLALPFLSAILVLLCGRARRNLLVGLTALAPVGGLLLLAGFLPAVLERETTQLYMPWLPALGLNFSLHLMA